MTFELQYFILIINLH